MVTTTAAEAATRTKVTNKKKKEECSQFHAGKVAKLLSIIQSGHAWCFCFWFFCFLHARHAPDLNFFIVQLQSWSLFTFYALLLARNPRRELLVCQPG